MNTGNTVGEYLTNVFTACGITPEQLNTFLTADTKMDTALPDDFKSKVGDILTMNAARANDSLRGHFRGEVYNGLDAALDKIAGEYNLGDIYNPIKASETKTTDRIAKLISGLQSTYEKRVEEAGKGQSDEEASKIRTELEAKIKELQNKGLSIRKISEELNIGRDKVFRLLRENETPVIARIVENRVLFDMRTLLPEDEKPILKAISGLIS